MTYPIGELLQHRAPESTVDREGRLQVLYLGAPDRYVHVISSIPAVRSPSGPSTSGAQAEILAWLLSPMVKCRVAGGMVFDPEAQKARKAKLRKISERPSMLFK